MRFVTSSDFPLSVPKAHALLTNPEFLDAVARASQPISYEVRVDGLGTQTRHTLANEGKLRSLIGPSITLIEDVTWDPVSGDERTGNLLVSIEGKPASYQAQLRLAPGGRGAQLDFDGEIVVDIPLFGSLIEKQAIPVITKALAIQQAVADLWVLDN